MQNLTFGAAYGKNFGQNWADMIRINKPVIAAVAGYAVSILCVDCARFGSN